MQQMLEAPQGAVDEARIGGGFGELQHAMDDQRGQAVGVGPACEGSAADFGSDVSFES